MEFYRFPSFREAFRKIVCWDGARAKYHCTKVCDGNIVRIYFNASIPNCDLMTQGQTLKNFPHNKF